MKCSAKLTDNRVGPKIIGKVIKSYNNEIYSTRLVERVVGSGWGASI